MKTPSQRPALKAAARLALLVLAPAGFAAGCTDLTENPPSNITPDNYFQNDAQVQSALAGVYSSVRNTQGDYFNVSEVSSDEVIVPTRGNNWLDQGQWVELWQHSYAPNSGAARNLLNGAYGGLSSGIARANAVLQALQASNSDAAKQGIAETRVLRAWFYFMLMDAFGGVPVVTQPGVGSQPRASRDSVARFVEAELLAARPALPATRAAGGGDWGRVSQGSVDAILAMLYTNWPVFTGTVTASTFTPGQPRYNDVLTVTNRLINSGAYTLAPDSATWRANFTANNQGSKESIFVVRNKAADGLGLDFPNRTLHYNSFNNPGGWNGFSTIAEVYDQWDNTDARKSVFLVGPQRKIDTGDPAFKQDNTTPLVFTRTISNLNAADEAEGIRNNKFSLDPSHFQQNNGNDFTIYRISNAYLDRAEALWRLGRDAEALADLNKVRARVYNPPQTLSGALSADIILRERLRETFFEGKRRQDMIRLGGFNTPRPEFPSTTQSSFAAYRMLFPIPQPQLEANPLLQQNPGY